MSQTPSLQLGQHGEDLASEYLQKLGYRIIKRNYRCKIGEIDIIATHQEYLIFCEVKTRKGSIHPIHSVGFRKQQKLKKLGEWYIMTHHCYHQQPRFDIICIQMKNNRSPNIEHFINAFY